MIQLAVSNIAWEAAEDEAAAEVLAAFGVHTIEVAPTKYWPAPCEPPAGTVAERRAWWERRGFSIGAMQALLFGMPHLKVFGTAEEQAATLGYLSKICHLGAGLGAHWHVFGSPRNRDRGDRDEKTAFAQGVEFFRRSAEIAENAGVVVCIEPNPVEYQCNFITHAEPARRLVEAVGHPHFGLHLDAGILTMNREPVEATLDACLAEMRHFHVSEPQLACIGSGGVDHRRIGAYLRRIGYDGLVSIEMRASADRVDNLARLRQALTIAQEAYLKT